MKIKIKYINFMRFRYYAFIFSWVLFAVMFGLSIKHGGLNWGIDFRGGVKLTAQFPETVKITDIRKALSDNKINGSVQSIGPEEKNIYIIATKLITDTKRAEDSVKKITDVFEKTFPGVKRISLETVGPSIGDFLKKSAYKMALLAILLQTIYLAFRFEFRYSVGAMVALLHDIVLSVMFCGAFNIEINIPVIAALLTIFGYSVNDTIVVFDRIRENVGKYEDKPLFNLMNDSINQTLNRTVLTAALTQLSVLSLFLLGGVTLRDFAAVLLFGFTIGVYSSIYMASPVVLWWEQWKNRKEKTA